MFTYLYFKEMNIDPADPKGADRDRFVLSKGHTTPGLYATLANRGFFPVEDLKTFRRIDSYLQGHPNMNLVPGVDMSTGSLGQGVSTAAGMALAAKHTGKTNRVYTLLGDGEIQEGQCWEAFMFAAHYKLDNFVAVIDNNGLQIDGKIADVMSPYPIVEKLEAFGFHVVAIDGHDFDAIEAALNSARETKGKPTAIVMTTIKGKDVSFMENNAGWHGKAPNAAEYEQAMNELKAIYAELEAK
jgi:transketolase